MEHNLNKTAHLFNIPFLQISPKQPPFHSKVHNLTVRKRINIPVNNLRFNNNFPLIGITNQPQTTSIPSFQLSQNDYHQLSFTEMYDPNPQVQYLNVILENKTKDPIAILKNILGYIDFPEECNVTQPQSQLYTAYNLNQLTQTLLYHIYPDTFEEVHNEYTPINTHFDDSPVLELNHI